MARWISEAGDPPFEPRPEYVEALRSTILGRLGPKSRPPVHWRLLLAVASGLAACLLVTVILPAIRPKIAWGQVAEAMQGKPWIHGKTLGPDGQVVVETWFSPRNRLMGFRHGSEAEFHDLSLREYTKYVADENTLYRLPEQDERRGVDLDFYRQLLDPKGPSRSPIPGMEVVGQARNEVVNAGRNWVDIELSLKVIAADRPPLKFRWRVDPLTRLPHSSRFETNDGSEIATLYDYPDAGPVDIHDLGVPKGLKVVDRIPGDDLERLRDGFKAGRTRFDDYRGLVVNGLADGFMDNVSRVYRKGRKWRVEGLHPKAGDSRAPRDADEAWWKAHERDYLSVVSAICDGEKVRYYRLKDPIWRPDAKEAPPVQLTMTQEIPPSDDPFMPWPHLLPEQLAHPSIWPPSEGREITIDPKPSDGPPGTIRVRVRDTHFPDDGKHPDLYRLWVDPLANYVAMRAETSVFKASGPPNLEFIDTNIVESLARSPGGHAYPTRVRRKTSDLPSEQLTIYYLDFQAEIPDELFRPL